MGRLASPPTLSAQPLVQGMVTLLTAECIIRQLASSEMPDHTGAMEEAVDADATEKNLTTPAAQTATPASPVASGWSTAGVRLTRGLDMPARDWDALFRAVQVRLSGAIADPVEPCSEELQQEIAATTQRIVIECMAALDNLHSSLTHERDLQEHFEVAVFNAQSDLAKALGAIAKSQKSQHRAGARRAATPTASAASPTPAHRPPLMPYAPVYGALVNARTQREAQRSHTRAQAVRSAE